VSLRFKFQEVPGGNYEGAETVDDKLSFDTVGEIQDAMGELFESGEAPFNLQESVLDLDATRAAGDYTEPAMRAQIQQFQRNLFLTLDNQGDTEKVDEFIGAVSEFMNQADDLSEFRNEADSLMGEVKQSVEYAEAGADSIAARMGLMEEMRISTEEGFKRELNREANEAPVERNSVAVASTVSELPQQLGSVLASLEEDTASRFGDSAMDSFNPDQFA